MGAGDQYTSVRARARWTMARLRVPASKPRLQNPDFPLGYSHRLLCFCLLHVFEFDFNMTALEAEKIPFDIIFIFNSPRAGMCLNAVEKGLQRFFYFSHAPEGTRLRSLSSGTG